MKNVRLVSGSGHEVKKPMEFLYVFKAAVQIGILFNSPSIKLYLGVPKFSSSTNGEGLYHKIRLRMKKIRLLSGSVAARR